jgi:hypothetical protein
MSHKLNRNGDRNMEDMRKCERCKTLTGYDADFGGYLCRPCAAKLGVRDEIEDEEEDFVEDEDE